MKKPFCFYLFFYRVRTKIIFVPFLIANSSFNFCKCDACPDFCKCCCEDYWKENKAEDFVNEKWLDGKENKDDLVLKLLKKENGNKYKTENGKIQIELEGNENKTKIKDQENLKKDLKLDIMKWALFEIIYKKEEEEKGINTVYLYCSDIKSEVDKSVDCYRGIFEGKKGFLSISVLVCDTSEMANMNSMFCNCSDLEILNIAKLNTVEVDNMEHIFNNCSSLTKLDISKFNTSKVNNMSWMFYGCDKLQQITVSNQAKKKILEQLEKENFNENRNDNDTWTLTRENK